MGVNTKISWATHTWNPWQGCSQVSEGCMNCYMFREKKRYGQNPRKLVRSAKATFNAPLNKNRYVSGDRVFVCSWSDFFHEDVPYEWHCDAFDVMSARPDLTFMILTKRPENITPDTWIYDHELSSWDYLWLGVTAENQEQADKRKPILLNVPAAVRFISVEPMLSEIDFDKSPNYYLCGIDWVICGCESGPGARPMHPDWVRSLRDQCQSANVPFFLKQMMVDGKLVKDPFLDGRQWLEFPEIR